MKVICTGISGVDRLGYLKEVQKGAGGVENLSILNVGEIMFEIAKHRGCPISEERVLNMDTPLLEQLRISAYEELALDAKGIPDWIMVTHACFRWKDILLRALNARDLGRLEHLWPDFYVTIVDSVAKVKERLDKERRWEGHDLRDLLTWQDEEIFLTETVADLQRKSHYVIAREQPDTTLLNLMFESDMPKAYSSYPITHMDAEQIEQAQHFVQELRKQIVVFDPLAIRDMEFASWLRLYMKHRDHLISQGHAPSSDQTSVNVSLDLEEELVKAANDEMKLVNNQEKMLYARLNQNLTDDERGRIVHQASNQTVARDYKLIRQSDMVIVYYPSTKLKVLDEEIGEVKETGLMLLSPGVISEMVYGFTHDKQVYAIWLSDKDPSPFFDYHCTKRYGSVEQFIEDLDEILASFQK